MSLSRFSCLLLFLIPLCVAVDANGRKKIKGFIDVPKDGVAAVQQLREERPCKNCKICTIQGGYCISKKTGHCNGKKLRSLCWSRLCTCCIETSLDERVDNLVSDLISVREEIGSKPSYEEMESQANSTALALNTINDKISVIPSIDDRVKNLEFNMMISVEEIEEIKSQIASSSVELSTILDKLPTIQAQLYCILNKYSFYNGSCYFFSSTAATWQNARDICGQKGGDLVIINNDEKFNFLREQVTGEPWVGAYENGTEGEYLWVDGSSLSFKSPWWHDTQPDNWMTNADCVHFWALKKLADAACTMSLTYICEITPVF